jgi:hypothetical protein
MPSAEGKSPATPLARQQIRAAGVAVPSKATIQNSISGSAKLSCARFAQIAKLSRELEKAEFEKDAKDISPERSSVSKAALKSSKSRRPASPSP